MKHNFAEIHQKYNYYVVFKTAPLTPPMHFFMIPKRFIFIDGIQNIVLIWEITTIELYCQGHGQSLIFAILPAALVLLLKGKISLYAFVFLKLVFNLIPHNSSLYDSLGKESVEHIL